MPAAKGKVELKVMLPQELKEQLDADAAARGLDRSAWMTMLLQSSYDEDGHGQVARLDQLIRDHAALREQVTQMVESLHELVASLQKTAAPVKHVYPAPAILEDVYPELKAMRETTVDQMSLLPPKPVESPKKGWPWRR